MSVPSRMQSGWFALVYVCVFVCASVRVCLFVCLFVCLCECACVCACMPVCISVHSCSAGSHLVSVLIATRDNREIR